MSHPFRDEDIPVLTEVIEEITPHEMLAPAPAASLATPALPAPFVSTSAVPRWSDADREALEKKLQERILRQLQDQIDTVLEKQVRDVLADVLQTAVSQLADDIRVQLQTSMERVVAQAVAQEIAKLPDFKP